MLGAIHMVACLMPSVCVMICGGPGAQPASPYLSGYVTMYPSQERRPSVAHLRELRVLLGWDEHAAADNVVALAIEWRECWSRQTSIALKYLERKQSANSQQHVGE